MVIHLRLVLLAIASTAARELKAPFYAVILPCKGNPKNTYYNSSSTTSHAVALM